MTDKIFRFGKMIYEWLSQFAPTYRGVLPSGEKPEDAYIRFDGYFDNFASQFILPVVIYKTNTTSYSSVLLLADKIESAIGDGGICIGDRGMRIHIEKGSPFYQDRADEDETVRSGYINLLISIYAVSAPTKYVVEYLSENYDFPLYQKSYHEEGDVFTLPENKYVKLYYTFIGWRWGESIYQPNTEFTMPPQDVYFWTEWEATSYHVEFYADDILVDTRVFTIEDYDITPPAVPNKDGYVGYWEPYTLIPVVQEPIRVDAIYTPRNYNLYAGTFKAGGQHTNLKKGVKS